MTERSHGLALGKFTAAFVGLVAMAALVTGAVVAANAPSPAVAVNDANTGPNSTATSTATDPATISVADRHEASEDPSFEASEHPSRAPKSSASVKPAASCDPSLDAKEDQAERVAKAQSGDYDDDKSPNPNASPKVARTPEASEPPHCFKADPNIRGDQKSGKDGTGHGGLIGKTFAPRFHFFPRGH